MNGTIKVLLAVCVAAGLAFGANAEAQKAFNKFDYSKAIDEFMRVIELDPN
ncbi:MAG: hypothetical protein LBI57_02775 [Helicobacteraceae bacterium]|jgi:hypothetical protein|nr:hypothetical protein [Helicobacteraceae bacterium]